MTASMLSVLSGGLPSNVACLAIAPLPRPFGRTRAFLVSRGRLVVLIEDTWINNQAYSVDLSELEDCSIAVDATYYLSQLLDTSPAHEPLLSALGGLTGIQTHINENLDLWNKNRVLPFFIFDGQSITGQDEVGLKRRRAANKKTDEAWDLYSRSEAEKAVSTFGANAGMAVLNLSVGA
ncbi:hypothetical protein E5D57_003869 [Metarhizium anisopliae]|nr:hypothetical protein E5D57_003869 [Metarhizium anisopliae]